MSIIEGAKNYIYIYMIKFFMIYLSWTSYFLYWINSLGIKIKKLTLNKTRGAKLNFNWILIFTLN